MSNTEALPPLPEPLTPAEWLHYMYTADQMRAYAQQALAQPASRTLGDILDSLPFSDMDVPRLRAKVDKE